MNAYEWIKTFFGELSTRACLFLVRNDTSQSDILRMNTIWHLSKKNEIAVKSCACNKASQWF